VGKKKRGTYGGKEGGIVNIRLFGKGGGEVSSINNRQVKRGPKSQRKEKRKRKIEFLQGGGEKGGEGESPIKERREKGDCYLRSLTSSSGGKSFQERKVVGKVPPVRKKGEGEDQIPPFGGGGGRH